MVKEGRQQVKFGILKLIKTIDGVRGGIKDDIKIDTDQLVKKNKY